MVKGVNKTIIEINNTGSKYFDRVVLFINPAYRSVPVGKLENKAAEIIRLAEPTAKVAKRSRKTKKTRLLLPLLLLAAAIIFFFIK